MALTITTQEYAQKHPNGLDCHLALTTFTLLLLSVQELGSATDTRVCAPVNLDLEEQPVKEVWTQQLHDTAQSANSFYAVECPGSGLPCSGNGKCLSMRQAAGLHGRTYDNWDAQRVFGCVCDDGFEGHDCSQLYVNCFRCIYEVQEASPILQGMF